MQSPDDGDDPPLDTRRPFSRADGLAADLSPKVLRGPRFRRMFPGVLVDADVEPSPSLRVQAALCLFPASAFASHQSAARVYDITVPHDPLEHVTVLDPDHRRRPAGITCHVGAEPRTRTFAGVRVSDPCQLFVELATTLSLVDLVVAGDRLVRRGLTTAEALRAHCRAVSEAGAAQARVAAAYVRAHVDSPMETRLRMLLVLAGLPEPEVNTIIRDIDGEPVRRYDLSWPAAKVVVEYDGRHHAEREDQWESDLERREAIDDDGWRILVVTSKGIYREPGHTVERVWRLLARRGLAGLPARPVDAWRPHFGR